MPGFEVMLWFAGALLAGVAFGWFFGERHQRCDHRDIIVCTSGQHRSHWCFDCDAEWQYANYGLVGQPCCGFWSNDLLEPDLLDASVPGPSNG